VTSFKIKITDNSLITWKNRSRKRIENRLYLEEIVRSVWRVMQHWSLVIGVSSWGLEKCTDHYTVEHL